MATCVGCGLTTDPTTGVLMAHVDPDGCIDCDDTDGLSVKVCPTGGIQCLPTGDPSCPAGGLALDPANLPITPGCGIDYAGGTISVDPCTNGGILCGPIADDPDQCIAVNVGNQGAGPCIDLGQVLSDTNCQHNGCNGLARTCDGSLWAPPKKAGYSGISSQQTVTATMAPLLHSKLSMDADFPPTHQGANEWIMAASPADTIMCYCYFNTSCNRVHGNTFTNGYTPIVIVAPGQVHRFSVWERLDQEGQCPCSFAGQAWVLQNQILFDEFGPGKSSGYAAAFIDSSWIITDPNLSGCGQMCITYQRFGPGPVGPGGRPNDVLSGGFGLKREYLHTVNGIDCFAHDLLCTRGNEP